MILFCSNRKYFRGGGGENWEEEAGDILAMEKENKDQEELVIIRQNHDQEGVLTLTVVL